VLHNFTKISNEGERIENRPAADSEMRWGVMDQPVGENAKVKPILLYRRTEPISGDMER
jgi:hypothetical protein